jgi:hypothetical protein
MFRANDSQLVRGGRLLFVLNVPFGRNTLVWSDRFLAVTLRGDRFQLVCGGWLHVNNVVIKFLVFRYLIVCSCLIQCSKGILISVP